MNLESCSLTKLSIRKKEWREKTMKSIFKVLLCICALSISGAGAAYAGASEGADNASFVEALTYFRAKDYARAVELMAPLVLKKDPRALSVMGSMYANGEGVKKNITEAIRLYKTAAELGYARGAFNLGSLYYKGIEVNKNYDLAIKYYSEAAALKDGEAQYNLGLMIAKGEGTPKNNVNAYRFFRAAESNGISQGKAAAEILMKEMTLSEISEASK